MKPLLHATRRLRTSDVYELNGALDALARGRISHGKFVDIMNDWLRGVSDWDPRDLGGSDTEAIVWYVKRHPGCTSTEAAEALGLPRLSVTRLLSGRLRSRGEVHSTGSARPLRWWPGRLVPRKGAGR